MLAICFRMEKLNLRKLIDQIKVSRTIVAVLGALIVTLYKSPPLLTPQDHSAHHTLHFEQSNWPLVCLLFILGFVLISLWSILQADTSKSYPNEVAIIFFLTLFGTIQTVATSVFLVEGQSQWKIHHKIDVVAILYAISTTSQAILFQSTTTNGYDHS